MAAKAKVTPAKPAPAAKVDKPVMLTLAFGKLYNPRTDWTDKGWISLQKCIEKGTTFAQMRSKKDTPITGNNHNHQFAAYCVRRGWVNRVLANGDIVDANNKVLNAK
jgi:hypothetical protein